MCYIYASTERALYECQTRSVRIDGVVTSVRLEQRFWEILEKIAAEGELSLGAFLTTLYSEVIELRGEIGNFSSLLRVVCTEYLNRQAEPVSA